MPETVIVVAATADADVIEQPVVANPVYCFSLLNIIGSIMKVSPVTGATVNADCGIIAILVLD